MAGPVTSRPGTHATDAPPTGRVGPAPVASAIDRAEPAPWWQRQLVALPETLALAVTGWSVAAVVALLVGAFDPVLVVVVGFLAAACAVLLRGRPGPAASTADVLASVGALVVAAASTAVNFTYSAQTILVERDPGVYAVAGQWLAAHSALPVPGQLGVFGAVKGVMAASPGLGLADAAGDVTPQGNHLVPALIALVGHFLGDGALLKAPVIIAGVAVLAFFGFTRRLAGPGWGLVATVALAVSMPFIGFARPVYTEPLTLLFAFAGLALLWEAGQRRRARSYLLAGWVFGGAAMARIDGFVILLVLPVVAASLLLAARRGERTVAALHAVSLGAGAGVGAALGWADLDLLSGHYFGDLQPQFGQIEKAGLALLVGAVVLVAVCWSLPRWTEWRPRATRWFAPAGGVLVAAGAILLATRPLWYVAHHLGAGGYSTIATFQKVESLPIDPARSYDEMSVSWVAWYYGWPMVVLGFAGLSYAIYRLVRGRLIWLPFVVLTLGEAALYLVRPSITPDQIWAMRRFLPVVIPGLLAAAALILHRLWQGRWLPRLAAGGLAAVIIIVPAVVAAPLATVREGVPELAHVEALCDALPAKAAVLTADSRTSIEYLPTIRAYCGVPAAALVAPTAGQLADVRRSATAHGRTLYVVAFDPAALKPLGYPATAAPVSKVIVTKWSNWLEEVPSAPHRYPRTLYLAAVASDGTLRPVSP